jgi:hypothetical protein
MTSLITRWKHRILSSESVPPIRVTGSATGHLGTPGARTRMRPHHAEKTVASRRAPFPKGEPVFCPCSYIVELALGTHGKGDEREVEPWQTDRE